MTASDQDFTEFMRRRGDVARAYVRGDPAPLGEIAAHSADTTFLGPGGGHLRGGADVWAAYVRGAGSFEPGGDTELEVLAHAASGDLAYWVGIQRADVRLAGGEAVEMSLRVTEVFRREADGWKLLHRHADPLVNAPDGGP